MIKNLKNKKKGFTLIELIIVIAIIAILAAVAIPKFGEVRKDAALKTDIANAKNIASAATALIAEENLAESTYYVNNDAKMDNEIEKYLQNPPKPQTKNYVKYKVVVGTKGSVTVSMVQETETTDPKPLFPQ